MRASKRQLLTAVVLVTALVVLSVPVAGERIAPEGTDPSEADGTGGVESDNANSDTFDGLQKSVEHQVKAMGNVGPTKGPQPGCICDDAY